MREIAVFARVIEDHRFHHAGLRISLAAPHRLRRPEVLVPPGRRANRLFKAAFVLVGQL
jgi:hypothetical protein